MSKVAVVYWSSTGNTEAMAKIIADAAAADLITAGDFDAAKAETYEAIALGCPAMGTEELEDSEFQPMYDGVKSVLANKKVAFFGSYGWGDGEWMRTWEEDAANAGIKPVCESVICCEAPDADAEAALKKLAAALA